MLDRILERVAIEAASPVHDVPAAGRTGGQLMVDGGGRYLGDLAPWRPVAPSVLARWQGTH